MLTHMGFVLKKKQGTWLLKQREGRSSFLSVEWESAKKSTPSPSPPLCDGHHYWSWLGVSQLSYFIMGMHLLQNWNFPQEDFEFAVREKSYEKNFSQVFHFGWLQLKPWFLKIDMKLFITSLLEEPGHFQLGIKYLWNLANQFTLIFLQSFISSFVSGDIPVCMYTLTHACMCFPTCKQTSE